MYRRLAPLLPRCSTDNVLLRTPVTPGLSPANHAPELVDAPTIAVEDEPALAPQPQPQPQPQPSLLSGNEASSHSAILEAPYNFEPWHPPQPKNSITAPHMWPSELRNQGDPTWLLPTPCGEQASTLALVVRTEIQSHNITREMLYSTERRRVEAVQKCSQLEVDARSWAAAYNNLTTALGRCAEEFSRVSAENVALKTELQAAQNPRPDLSIPNHEQFKLLRRKLSGRGNNDHLPPSFTSESIHEGQDLLCEIEAPISPGVSEYSTYPYSPEV